MEEFAVYRDFLQPPVNGIGLDGGIIEEETLLETGLKRTFRFIKDLQRRDNVSGLEIGL